MAYCTSADVSELMGQTFSATSRPTTNEVEDAVDQIAAEIDGVAATVGYTTPIASALGIALLRKYNRYGAAVSAWHTGVVRDDEPARVTYWQTEYKDFLTRLKKGDQVIPGETPGQSPNSSFSASFRRDDGYSTYNPSGILGGEYGG